MSSNSMVQEFWSWGEDEEKPDLKQTELQNSPAILKVNHSELDDYYLYCEGNPELLFTDNETNTERIFGTPTRLLLLRMELTII